MGRGGERGDPPMPLEFRMTEYSKATELSVGAGVESPALLDYFTTESVMSPAEMLVNQSSFNPQRNCVAVMTNQEKIPKPSPTLCV